MILVDTNVLLDLLTDDPAWGEWSQRQLEDAAGADSVCVNEIVFAELSVRYDNLETVEETLALLELPVEPTPRAALFLAGKAFADYRRRGGNKTGVPPDFFIGAHAAVMQYPLLTRDVRRHRSYFPTVELITPQN